MNSPNQQQIARLLNLSRTTVSRSLSNHPAIHPETRAKVQSLAGKLGYRSTPTRVVRRSKQSKRLVVGVLIGMPTVNLGMATFPAVLKGIRDRAAIDHVSIEVVSRDPSELNSHNLRQPVFRQIRASDWRGLILIYPFAPEVVEQLSRKISTVSVLTEYDHLAIDTIDTDHSDIIGLIGRLSKLGHRRIGFVTWRYGVGGRWASRRFASYAEGMFQHGLEFRPEWTINVHGKQAHLLTHEAVADYVAQTSRDSGVTAWVCAADHQAYQLVADLRLRGLRVPEDVSVTGFDGIEPPPGLPQLTTLAVAHADIGAAAVSRLLSRILHPTSTRRKILVETNPVEGATIAAPRSSRSAPQAPVSKKG
jgi:LacI family transcriptional regulator